jgi:hypothetical protein
MGRRRLKLRDLRKILRSFGVDEDKSKGKGDHTTFYKHFEDGCFSYPIPDKPDVLPCYVSGARRKFRLTQEDGITDDDFFGRA